MPRTRGRGWKNSYNRSQSGGRSSSWKGNSKWKKRAYYPTFDLDSLTPDTWATDDYDDSDLMDVLDRTMAASGRLNTSVDSSDDLEDGVLFGTIQGAIVGIKYYKGEVNNNEMVAMVREPENQYDCNAIKVVNIWGQQVGHIKREMASALAPIVDGKLARIEGVVPFGKNNQYRIPVDISVWGQGDNRPRVVDMLAYRGVRFEPQRSRSEPWRGGMSQSGPTKVYKPRASAAAPIELTKSEMHNELDQLFDNLKQVEKTTTMEPAEAIASTLYPHQKQALNWMCARENSDDLPPFWKGHGGSFLNTVTNFISHTRPATVRGGILADEMGLGKTLEMIALILTNFHDGRPLVTPNPESTQDVVCIDSDSDPDACDDNATTAIEKLAPATDPTVQITQFEPKIEPEKWVVPQVNDDPVAVVETGPILQLQKQDTIILESFPDNEVVIVVDDKNLGEPVPEPEVQIVSASGRPKRSSKKPVRYVFSGSDAELEIEEEVPRKKSKKKSQKDEVWMPQASQEGADDDKVGSQSVVVKAKATAKPKEPKHMQQQKKKKAGAKAKGKSLPDLQLPSLPNLPTLPGLDHHAPLVASTSTATTCDGALVTPQPQLQLLRGTSSHGNRCLPKGPRPTLILCPLSVISNWVNQFEEHVRPDVDLNVCTHYGADRAKSHTKLVNEDVVITTYSTLANEYKNKKGQSPLHKVEWLRVVLDEGHIIRNPNALQTKAVLDLKARRKWILTGTPIQNSIKDLWALISFLGLEPFKSNKMWWQRTIVRPINQGDKAAVARISQLMEQIALRRTKTQKVNGQLLVDLPTKTVFVQKVELSAEERAVYDSMAKEGKLAIGKYFKTGTLLTNYGNVLAILLRLRQLCCHPALIAAAVALKEADNSEEGQDDLKKKLVETLLAVLSQGADEECCICLDSLRGPVITPCAHVFCMRCINDVINAGVGAKCPLCRGNIRKETLVEVPREVQQGRKQAVDADWHSSAKVDAMMECLIRERAKDPSTKSIVVSQFTTLLDLVEKPLGDSGFNFVRLDGSMTAKRRTESMEMFCNPKPGSPTVILLSLKAGGVGINLTAASRVYLLDPAWNPASEDQCFDRCHRLGQTKDVIITKFVVKNSVEERMLELQDKKRKLMAGAFSEKLTTEERQQGRFNDIKILMDLSGEVPGTTSK